MARIAGINIPVEKNVFISLTYIYGIGTNSAKKICDKAHVEINTRVKHLSDDQVIKIREVIDREYIVEGNLRREKAVNIKKMMSLGSYRGLRHRRGLPVRGQSTHSNARTRKGVAKPIKNKK